MSDVYIPDYEVIPIDLIDNNAWNPNSMDSKDFVRLCEEIREVGFLVPIQVVPTDGGRYRILGGEHRVAAGKEIGMDGIPCVVAQGKMWDEEDLQKLVTVRLNALSGKVNPARMTALYDEMAHKYGEEQLQALFAYTDDSAWKSLKKTIQRGIAKTGLPKEAQKQFEERTKDSRTVEDLGLVLNNLFSQYGDTVDQSYMIFTYGKKNHIYLAMSKEVFAAVKKITKHCSDTGEDMNDVLFPALKEIAKEVSPKKSKKTKPAKADGVEY